MLLFCLYSSGFIVLHFWSYRFRSSRGLRCLVLYFWFYGSGFCKSGCAALVIWALDVYGWRYTPIAGVVALAIYWWFVFWLYSVGYIIAVLSRWLYTYGVRRLVIYLWLYSSGSIRTSSDYIRLVLHVWFYCYGVSYGLFYTSGCMRLVI